MLGFFRRQKTIETNKEFERQIHVKYAEIKLRPSETKFLGQKKAPSP